MLIFLTIFKVEIGIILQAKCVNPHCWNIEILQIKQKTSNMREQSLTCYQKFSIEISTAKIIFLRNFNCRDHVCKTNASLRFGEDHFLQEFQLQGLHLHMTIN